MDLVLEQRFELGRFHATRWNQNPFEDPYGEWPPSPWRLVRALAARWFQYSRETGDAGIFARDDLLTAIASALPSYSLPAGTWRGPAIKQYQPTEVTWTDPSKRAAAVKEPKTTLVEDHFHVVPEDQPVYWVWGGLDLRPECVHLLERLLERTLYFGRAESPCQLRVVDGLPSDREVNCRLWPVDDGSRRPVLAPMPKEPLRLDIVLADTGGILLAGRPVPPGTAWFYASVPPQHRRRAALSRRAVPSGVRAVQFAIGGRVLPQLEQCVRVTGRFRGSVLKRASILASGGASSSYINLTAMEKARFSLLSGKDENGAALRGHNHAYFGLWAGADACPERMIVWRSEPFTALELEAMLQASEAPILWEPGAKGWAARIVPLPFRTPLPSGFSGPSVLWESVTPFVPPAARHRLRSNGKARDGESVERNVRRLLASLNAPPLTSVELERSDRWLPLHLTRERKIAAAESRTPLVRPGFRVRLRFETPLSGPLAIGDSCHFGLGWFRALG